MVEIKNTTLTRSEAYSLLTSLQAKLPAVQGLSEQVTLGIAAREIEDREELREEGFYCMEIEEMLGQNTMKKAKET